MLKLLLITATVMLSAIHAAGQRYLPRQTGIELSGGLVDGFKFKPRSGDRFYCNLSVSTYNRKGNRWVAGVEYLQKGLTYRAASIPVSGFTAEGGHYLKIISDRSKTVFLSAGASAMMGYELVNRGRRKLYDGATLSSVGGFIYGAAISVELETFISDRIVLLIRARERMTFGGATSPFKFQLGAGLKIIVN
jgi:hypothetical protein